MCRPALAALGRPRHHLAHLGAPDLDRRELLEGGVGVLGEHPRERRLAGAGRPVQDHRVRLAGLDRRPQRRRRPEQVLLADELLQRPRAHPRRQRQIPSAAAGAGGSSGTSKSRPIALSMRVVPAVTLATVAREWGRIGVLGFGGPPAHVALLRDLTVERRRWIDDARVRGRVRRLQPAARPGEHADGDLLRPAGRRAVGRDRRRPRLHPARPRRGAGDRRGRAGDDPPPAVEAFGGGRGGGGRRRRRAGRPEADRPAARASSTSWPARSARRSRARSWSRSCCSPAWSSSAAHTLQTTVWPALIWLAVKVGALSYGGGYVIIPLMYDDALALDERAEVRQRRRVRADHAGAGHPHDRARRLRGGRASAARSVRDRRRVRAVVPAGDARRPPLRAAAHERERARLPRRRGTGRRGRDPRRRDPARTGAGRAWQWLVAVAAALRARAARARRSTCWSAAR